MHFVRTSRIIALQLRYKEVRFTMAAPLSNKYYDEALLARVREEYDIPAKYFTDKVKRGLRNSDGTGVMAGVTKVGRVIGYNIEDGEIVPTQGRLYYRGINVEDIVKAHVANSTFGYEEVAFLLLMGYLPNKAEIRQFAAMLSRARALPEGFTEDIILKNPSPNVMNKLARSVLTLYSYDKDPDNTSLENMLIQSIELIARFPTIVANTYAAKRHYIDGESLHIHYPREDLSAAENFLLMLHPDQCYTQEEAHLLDILMILHAEHGGGNNSAFVCRALSSSGTDTYGAISGAVNSLKGPLHGGANAKVRAMFHDIKAHVADPADDGAMRDYLSRMLDGTVGDHSGKIYGLGHAVYTLSDPRAEIIKLYAGKVAKNKGMEEDLAYLRSIERNGCPLIVERKGMTSPISANVDLYSGFVLQMLGIPDELFTPLFAVSRISGWCAHRIEEVMSAKRIMRPAYRAAKEATPYVPLEQRG